MRCAFWETIARGRFTRRKRREMRRQDIETKLVVWLCSTEPLTLVDLRADGPVRMGAPTAVIHDAHLVYRARLAKSRASSDTKCMGKPFVWEPDLERNNLRAPKLTP